MEEDRQGNKLIHQRKGRNKSFFPLLKSRRAFCPAHIYCCIIFGETELGKFGEKFSKNEQKTAVFWQKTYKNSVFLKTEFASDSVIRWFKSSYPSHFGIIRTSS